LGAEAAAQARARKGRSNVSGDGGLSGEKKRVSERRVKGEKGGLLAIATALIAAGAQALGAGEYARGSALLAAGVVLLFLREHFKFHRYGEHNAAWRRNAYP